MTNYLKIKNWEQHQHYKNRCPPWIKLHAKILNDKEFSMLSRASKCLQMLLWILASENDGKIKNDIDEIRFRLRDETIKESEIKLLIEKGFLISGNSAGKQLQADANKCSPETETEGEKSKEEYNADFLEFYSAYPLKKAKAKAFESWKKLKPNLKDCLFAIKNQMAEKSLLKAENEFCPPWKHPTTWLNQKCWEDEVQTTTKKIIGYPECLYIEAPPGLI